MKKLNMAIIALLVTFTLSASPVFAQQSKPQDDLVGVWYRITDMGNFSLYYFSKDGMCLQQTFYDSAPSRQKPLSAVTPVKYQIKDLDTIQIGNKTHRFNVSSDLLIWPEYRRDGIPSIYHPVAAMDKKNLAGSWKITGESVDIDLKIDEKTFTLSKGKQVRAWSYASDGYPALTLTGADNKPVNEIYFFHGPNVLMVNIPDEGVLYFQRVVE